LILSQCGTLKEFIKVDERRLHKAPNPSGSLSLDQISLLPLCGIPAYRAVAAIRSIPISPQAKVLVLDAHKGVGALTWQQFKLIGIDALVHMSSTDHHEFPSFDLQRAPTTLFGDPLALVKRMESSSLDAIIDTVGGRDMWEECRRVLRDNGAVRFRGSSKAKITHYS
jgi:NADPH:quinone reductase-like Zn-dependent oxidoreductase